MMMDKKKKHTDSEGDQPTAQAVELTEIEQLKEDLAKAEANSKEYLEAWQRERADFINFRRRNEQEKSEAGQYGAGEMIRKFLTGIDDLERALAHKKEGDVWADGIELVYRKFLMLLESEGVTRIEAEGKPFDPTYHEAILQEPSEQHESGVVIAVLQQGYKHKERILRPALVKVAQ
jgi:molecular chaperone GrpE